MLITFSTRARSPDVIMFDDVALQLLKLMGRRTRVPSAIEPADIPDALQKLRAALATENRTITQSQPQDDEDEVGEDISLSVRAGPLIELLEAAQGQNVPVMWES